MKNLKQKILLLISVTLFTTVSFAGKQCDNADYSAYFIDAKKAIDAAKKHPYDIKPRPETSTSDLKLIADETKGFLEGMIKGEKIPNPIMTFLKVMFTPSQIGTSSEAYHVASKETETASYMLNQLYMVLEEDGCINKKEIILPSLK